MSKPSQYWHFFKNSVALIKPGKTCVVCVPHLGLHIPQQLQSQECKSDIVIHLSGILHPPLLLFGAFCSPNQTPRLHLLPALSGVLHRHFRSSFLPNIISQSAGRGRGGGGAGSDVLTLTTLPASSPLKFQPVWRSWSTFFFCFYKTKERKKNPLF